MKPLLKMIHKAICIGYQACFLWLYDDFFPWLYRISGLQHAVRKFQSVDDNVKHPTGFLWAIGLYFAAYQVAVLNYQGAIEPLNRKADQINVGVDKGNHRYWLTLLPKVQNTETLIKPDIWDPILTIKSLLGTEDYNSDINQGLIEVVESLGKTDKLAGADLAQINLEGANLSDAYLEKTIISDAYLYKINLENAYLRDADLSETNLTEADLVGSDLVRTSLFMVFLTDANLKGANIAEASLYRADLERADLRWAFLEGANLDGAYLAGANLKRTFLRGVNGLTCEQVLTAIIDKKTQLPEYLTIKWKTDGSYSCKEKKD